MSGLSRHAAQNSEAPSLPGYIPDFSRRLAVGSHAEAALIGPPGIGRAHIRDTAVAMFPDFTHTDSAANTPDDAHDKSPLHLVGVVTEPMIWFHHFSSLYPSHSDERLQQREAAISCLTWMAQQSNEKLGIVYHRPNSPEVTAAQVHDHLIKGQSPAEADRDLIGRLLVTAMTIGV